MPRPEAERAARIELGGIEQMKEQSARNGPGTGSIRSSPTAATAAGSFARTLCHRDHDLDARAGDRRYDRDLSVVYAVFDAAPALSEPNRIMAVFEVVSQGPPVSLADPLQRLSRSQPQLSGYGEVQRGVGPLGARSRRASEGRRSPDF